MGLQAREVSHGALEEGRCQERGKGSENATSSKTTRTEELVQISDFNILEIQAFTHFVCSFSVPPVPPAYP
jgi:hypothetical protein